MRATKRGQPLSPLRRRHRATRPNFEGGGDSLLGGSRTREADPRDDPAARVNSTEQFLDAEGFYVRVPTPPDPRLCERPSLFADDTAATSSALASLTQPKFSGAPDNCATTLGMRRTLYALLAACVALVARSATPISDDGGAGRLADAAHQQQLPAAPRGAPRAPEQGPRPRRPRLDLGYGHGLAAAASAAAAAASAAAGERHLHQPRRRRRQQGLAAAAAASAAAATAAADQRHGVLAPAPELPLQPRTRRPRHASARARGAVATTTSRSAARAPAQCTLQFHNSCFRFSRPLPSPRRAPRASDRLHGHVPAAATARRRAAPPAALAAKSRPAAPRRPPRA